MSYHSSQPVSPFHAACPSYEETTTASQNYYHGPQNTSELVVEQQYEDAHCHAWSLRDDASPYVTYGQGTGERHQQARHETKMRNLDNFC